MRRLRRRFRTIRTLLPPKPPFAPPLIPFAASGPICCRPCRRRSGRVTTISRSEEHTSELQSLMRTSYAVFCLKKKKQSKRPNTHNHKINIHTRTDNLSMQTYIYEYHEQLNIYNE